MPLRKGNKVPKFSVVDENSLSVTNEDLLGRKTILFFYPADLTETCTEEACNIRDNLNGFVKMGYTIYGISPDLPKKHLKFIEKYNLNYSLLSDPTLKMIKAFKVWGPKLLFGRQYDGLLRTTFLVNEKCIISGVIEKVKSKEHSKQIMELIK